MIEQRITADWLKQMGAPARQVERFAESYPEGTVLNLDTALKAQEQGLDMIWVGCRLMTREQRRGFVLFALRQMQPYLVDSLRRAGLDAQGRVVEALDWGNLVLAERVLEAACSAAADAAKDAAMAAARAVACAMQDADMEIRAAKARDPETRQAAWESAEEIAWVAAWEVLNHRSGIGEGTLGAAIDVAKAASGAPTKDPFVAGELASAPARVAMHTTRDARVAVRLAADMEGNEDAKAANPAWHIADTVGHIAFAATYCDEDRGATAQRSSREKQIRWIWERAKS